MLRAATRGSRQGGSGIGLALARSASVVDLDLDPDPDPDPDLDLDLELDLDLDPTPTYPTHATPIFAIPTPARASPGRYLRQSASNPCSSKRPNPKRATRSCAVSGANAPSA